MSVMETARSDPARFPSALAGEALKVVTVRSTVWMPAAIAVTIIAIAVFVGATESLQPDDTIMGGALTGAGPAQVFAGAFGVLIISGEYGTGLIETTFLAVPRRGVVLAAKGVLVAVSMFVVGVTSCGIAYALGLEMLSGGGYAVGEPMPALIGVGLSFSAAGVLGLAIGALVRHSAGAITGVFSVTLLPIMLAPLFGDWERWIAGASPTAALQKLAQSSDAAPELAGSLGAWPSLMIVCGYAVAAVVAGWYFVKRRDV